MYVSSNAAFLNGSRFPCRILLLVHLSPACLASSSQSLNRYVFFPNNHIHLASFCGPHSIASVALSAFNSIPEQSFAFYNTKQGSNLQSIPLKGNWPTISLFATYLDVLLQLLRQSLLSLYPSIVSLNHT